MNPTEFIQYGVRALAGGTEVHYRSAVSRLYYGAFHTAKDILAMRCGIDIPIHEAHAKLPKCLMSADDLAVRDAGRKLDSLRQMRRIADYELGDPSPQSSRWAHRQMHLALQVLHLLEQWQTQATFEQTAETIRLFARDVLKLGVRNTE
jgi:uncharacterized protein (UPF0332 family)